MSNPFVNYTQYTALNPRSQKFYGAPCDIAAHPADWYWSNTVWALNCAAESKPVWERPELYIVPGAIVVIIVFLALAAYLARK